MRTFEGYVFSKNESGFLKYIRHFRSLFYFHADKYKYDFMTDIEDTVEASKFIRLDKQFVELLNEDEKRAIKYIGYHNPDDKKPENLESFLSTAYLKWRDVFFSEHDPIFGKISPFELGKAIEVMRFHSNINQSELASMVGVNRTTIMDIEKGKRLPSLELIYKISIIFKTTIDEIIKISII